MSLKILNNLTRKKELFTPLNGKNVKFYSCGPTTYDFMHVGNARALVVGDLMYRVLKTLGFNVTFVRNFTDVDDKIIAAAKANGVTATQHAEKFIHECNVDMRLLGLLEPTHTPKVTETIQEIIEMIEKILKNGHGYVSANGDVLFHVPSKSDYGKLSKKDLEGLEHGRRVEVDGQKKHPADFVLWKPVKEGEDSKEIDAAWPSPWGVGRPGWHIECSAMAKKFLGDQIDLHHGGVDLIFPHHENEIAQSESANGCVFCNTWAHNEFLNFASEKMSKSLGNVVTIRKFSQMYAGFILRHLLLSVHYRSKLDWSEEIIERAIQESTKIHDFWHEFKMIKIEDLVEDTRPESTLLLKTIQDIQKEFIEELENDFNSAGALGQFFSFLKEIKTFMEEKNKSKAIYTAVKEFMTLFSTSLNLVNDANLDENRKKLIELKGAKKTALGSDEVLIIEGLIQERLLARKNKNFKRSDEIRDELIKLGITIQDSPSGETTWTKK